MNNITNYDFQIHLSLVTLMGMSFYTFLSISHLLKFFLISLFLFSYTPILNDNLSIYEAFSNSTYLQHNFLVVLFSVFLIFIDRHQEYITRSVEFNERTKKILLLYIARILRKFMETYSFFVDIMLCSS